MVKGFYDAAAGMQARSLQQDTIANNLANVSTEGYKAQRLAFRSLLDHNMVVHRPGGSEEAWYRLEDGRYDVMKPGAVRVTDNPLDCMIEGDGFFSVNTKNGVGYTRDGRFTLDSEGRIITEGGFPLRLEGGGEISLPRGAELAISRDGTLIVNSNAVGKLELVKFEEGSKLERLGDNIVRPVDGKVNNGGVFVAQGQVEESNVDGVREMVDMIKTHRLFETISKSLTTIDDTLRVAINDVGRTS